VAFSLLKKTKNKKKHRKSEEGHFIDKNDLLGEEWRYLARIAFLMQMILNSANLLCVANLVQWLVLFVYVNHFVALVRQNTDRGYI
jgi:hypothetical protein